MKIYFLIKDPPENTKNIAATYDKTAQEIMEELYKMKPCKSISHTTGTNAIEVDARWKGTQISSNLKKLKKIQNFGEYIIYYDPVNDLKKAIEDHDFFKAYSMGCPLFEVYGTKILKKHFDEKKVPIGKDKLERIHLETILIMLYTHKRIDDVFYCNMTRINSIRNNLIVHRDITEHLDEKILEDITQYFDKILMCINKLESILFNNDA